MKPVDSLEIVLSTPSDLLGCRGWRRLDFYFL